MIKRIANRVGLLSGGVATKILVAVGLVGVIITAISFLMRRKTRIIDEAI